MLELVTNKIYYRININMKKIVKIFIVIGIFFVLVTFANEEPQISVLAYHNLDLKSKTDYTVSSQQLRDQIYNLRQRGYKFVTLKQVEDFYYKDSDLPSRSVAITFDDGNLNTYTIAYPLLKQLNVPFTLFIYPNAINVGHKMKFMNWDEVKELATNGVIIGSHSYSHPFLTRPVDVKTPEQYHKWLVEECLGSKQYIENKIGVSVNYFAIPFGVIDRRSWQALKNANYKLIFDINGMNNTKEDNPLLMHRMIIAQSESLTRVLSKIYTKPIYFDYTYPSNLERINNGNFIARYKIKNAANYDLKSVRLLFGKPKKGYEQVNVSMNYNEISIKNEAFYGAAVVGLDKKGRSCLGSWNFIYQKQLPSFFKETWNLIPLNAVN